jgi:hypothetical protein
VCSNVARNPPTSARTTKRPDTYRPELTGAARIWNRAASRGARKHR